MLQHSTNTLLQKTSAIIDKFESMAELTGERFNVFNILGMGSSEVKLHSALIAELLNPKGKHSLGELFLNHFLHGIRELNLDNGISQRIDNFYGDSLAVDKEKWTGYIINNYTEGGYIDIILCAKNGATIIIENKIYANDQKGQLRRYHNYKKDAILIYLTLEGKQANIETTFNDQYPGDPITPVCISYKTFIIDWLEKCKKDAVNHPTLRETITQYIYLLKELTHQTTNHFMKNEVVNLIAQNTDFIRSAQEIWANEEGIKLQILNNLCAKLRTYSEKAGWQFDTAGVSGKLGKKDTGFGFKTKDTPYWVYYYFRDNYEKLEVGIDWVPEQPKDDSLKEELRKHFQNFEYGTKLKHEDWIWGSVFKPWNVPWAEVQDNVYNEIIETTIIFLEKLDQFDSTN